MTRILCQKIILETKWISFRNAADVENDIYIKNDNILKPYTILIIYESINRKTEIVMK